MKFLNKIFAMAICCYSAMALQAQNVGIGLANPASKLSVKGNMAIGNNFAAIPAPLNGAIIEGHTVVGNSAYFDADDIFTSYSNQRYAICGYVTNGRASTTGTTASILSAALYGYIDGPGGLGLLIDHRANTNFGAIINTYAASGTAALKGDSESNNAHGLMGENPSTGLGFAIYCNGDFYYSGTVYNASDKNLKQNIRPYVGGLTQILALSPMLYEYKADLREKYRFSADEQVGFLAQELETVIPNLVREGVLTSASTQTRAEEESTAVETLKAKTVNYIGLIPVITSAIQEQQAQIELLKQENELIKAQLQMLIEKQK